MLGETRQSVESTLEAFWTLGQDIILQEFIAESSADSRHFIKYEWRETLCRRRVIDCGEPNRFWDESKLGFAPPPPRRGHPD